MNNLPKILIVDDDQDILIVMEALLKMNGYEVAVTAKGDEAIFKAETFCPQLILLDVRLSGTDGREICKSLKSTQTTCNIPVIMVSAHPGGVMDMKQYGADDFIAKPFDVKFLLNRIEDLVERN